MLEGRAGAAAGVDVGVELADGEAPGICVAEDVPEAVRGEDQELVPLAPLETLHLCTQVGEQSMAQDEA